MIFRFSERYLIYRLLTWRDGNDIDDTIYDESENENGRGDNNKYGD